MPQPQGCEAQASRSIRRRRPPERHSSISPGPLRAVTKRSLGRRQREEGDNRQLRQGDDHERPDEHQDSTASVYVGPWAFPNNVPEKASGSRKQPPYQGPIWARASKEANQRPDSTTELTSFGERMCKKRTALAQWALMIRAEAPPFKLAYPVWIGGSTTFVGALCNNC